MNNIGSVAITLRLQGESVKAARVWFEDRDPPQEVVRIHRAAARRLGVAYTPAPWRWLCWEPTDDRLALPPDFWKRVGSLAASGDNGPGEEALADFWLRWGPLLPTEDCALPIWKIRKALWEFFYLATLYGAGLPLRRGLPPALWLAESLLEPLGRLGRAAKGRLEFTLAPIVSGQPEWTFADADDWFRVPAPPMVADRGGRLAFSDRETGLRWLREEVLVPSAARLLGRAVRFIPRVTESGVALEAVCDSPFALAVAQMVFEHAEWKLCSCGCGRPVPPGRKYATAACKQRVKNASPYKKLLCYLNMQRRRGKLTEEECRRGHALARKLRGQHSDYEGLKQAVLKQL